MTRLSLFRFAVSPFLLQILFLSDRINGQGTSVPVVPFVPVTSAPVSKAPATSATVSAAPASKAPASMAPVSIAPASTAPVSKAPASTAPVSKAPVSTAPVSTAPVSTAPVSTAPITTTPVSTAPITTTPVSTAPASIAPVSKAPVTMAPSTTSPTTVPSLAPVVNTTAPVVMPSAAPSIFNTSAPTLTPTTSLTPSVAPSSQPSVSSRPTQLGPTFEPSTIPSLVPSLAPSIVPSLAPSTVPSLISTATNTTAPSASPGDTMIPSSAPVNAQGATRVDESVPNLQAIFAGVGELSVDDTDMLANTMNVWFEEYFNGPSSRRRWLRHERYQRKLQVAEVRNMSSVVDVGNNFVTSIGNTVTYTQTMNYMALPGALSHEEYALAPFNDADSNAALVTALRNDIPAFSTIESSIAVRMLEATNAPTKSPAVKSKSGAGLKLGAIIGIACGGALFVLAAGYGLLRMRGKDRDNGYVETGFPPPSQFHISSDDDEISRMDDPTVAQRLTSTSSIGQHYGDQSVATVDYDYSKAYGGGGDTSVVSSVGGTLGDTTRQTAGEVAAGSAAARAALGASYDSDRNAASSSAREEVLVLDAPAGKLGVVIDTPDDGAPVVHAVKDSSVIADKIRVGDKLIAVDDDDVRSMTAIKVSKLISKKSANPVRRLTIVRTSMVGSP